MQQKAYRKIKHEGRRKPANMKEAAGGHEDLKKSKKKSRI